MHSLLAIFAICLLAACSTSTPKGAAQHALTRPAEERIRWPARYHPDNSTFFVHNEVEIQASAKAVWDILIDIEAWPKWYEGAENVKLTNPAVAGLKADSAFTWKTMGMNWESRVREFLPPLRLATESRKAVIQGYHAWLIIPTPLGCKVITDESFRGPLGRLQGTFIPGELHGLHQIFLEELKKLAEAKTKR